MKLKEVIEKSKEELMSLVNLEISNVTGVEKTDEGWQVYIELIERKSVPDSQDLLGLYEVQLDEEGEMTRYERIKLRRRTDLEELEEVVE